MGALDLVRDKLDETFLVINGDLLTDLDLRKLFDSHRRHEGLLTVGVTDKKVQIDLGVLRFSEQRVVGFEEKPTFNFQVSMGIYVMEPGILEFIPKGVPFGFDDLMHHMLDKGLPVNAYHHEGSWMDIGRPEDFQAAQQYFSENEGLMLGI